MWYTDLCNIMLTGVAKSTKKTLADFENWRVFRLVFLRLYQDLYQQLSDFIEVKKETLSKRVIIESLIWYANACFFEFEGGVVSLPAAMNGSDLTIYGESRRCFVYSRNGKINKDIPCYFEGQLLSTVDKDTGVIVWLNSTRTPLIDMVMFYAQQIADSYRTLSVMRKRLKLPVIIQGDESQSASINSFYTQYQSNEEIIHLDTGFLDVDKTKITTISADADTAQIVELIDWYESKYREAIGIQSNGNIDKKGENLIQDEIHVNDEYEEVQLFKYFDYMKQYVSIVNKIWGDIISLKEPEKENEVLVDSKEVSQDVYKD